MALNQEITKLLIEEGCQIFGFADLSLLPTEYQGARRGAEYAIIMGEPYGTAEGMRANLSGDSRVFGMEGGKTSEPLERYRSAVKDFLKRRKYKSDIKYMTTVITYKMLATLAGIGWVGRCAVLTTREWGNALRLTAVATNAPLVGGIPIMKSECPSDCYLCADVCHANAIKRNAVLWERFSDGTGVHRDEFFDAKACRKGREIHDPVSQICGKCIAACPFTKRD